ncbi:MAG: YncE family protein [Flavisolibacter sp.]
MKKALFLLLTSVSLVTFAQNHTYKISKTYHIKSPGGWDYIAVNHGSIYVSHGTQVNILNEETGDSIGMISNTNGVHGIAFDDAMNRGYTSNGRSNSVTIFDLKSYQVLDSVATGENPDAIMYEPFTKTIITCNGRSKNLSVIDPLKKAVIHTIDVGGKPETAVSDAKGNLFVNIEDRNEIVEVSLKDFKVTQRWSLNPAEGPTGLAYDAKNNRLFAGCEKLLIVMNASTGKIVKQLPIGEGCDGVAFDPNKRLIFTSNGEGTLTVIKETGEDSYNIEGNYPTKRGARTITIDEKSGKLYLPTADFDSSQTQNGRPKMIPGSFQVLVVE